MVSIQSDAKHMDQNLSGFLVGHHCTTSKNFLSGSWGDEPKIEEVDEEKEKEEKKKKTKKARVVEKLQNRYTIHTSRDCAHDSWAFSEL